MHKTKKIKKIIYSNAMTDYIDGIMVLPEETNCGLVTLKKLGTI